MLFQSRDERKWSAVHYISWSALLMWTSAGKGFVGELVECVDFLNLPPLSCTIDELRVRRDLG